MGPLEFIILILVLFWALGVFVVPSVGGGLVHLLLVVALIVLLIRILQGRSIE